MRNNAWNEMDRTYTNKSSEKHFWTKFMDRNSKFADRNYQVWKRELAVLSGFLMGIRRKRDPFVQKISQLTGK
jgi:hypothetical protein